MDTKKRYQVYLDAKEFLNLFEELDYEHKIRLAKENPYVFNKFNELQKLVEECEEMGIAKRVD